MDKSDFPKLLTLFPNVEELAFERSFIDVPLSPMEVANEIYKHLTPGSLKKFALDLTMDDYLDLHKFRIRGYSDEIPQATEMLAKLGVEFVCKLPAGAE